MDVLLSATGGRSANIYEYHAESVAYFRILVPDAPDVQEAGADFAAARRVLDAEERLTITGQCAIIEWEAKRKRRCHLESSVVVKTLWTVRSALWLVPGTSHRVGADPDSRSRRTLPGSARRADSK